MNRLLSVLTCMLVATGARAATHNFNWASPPDAVKLANSTGTARYTSPEGISVNDTAGVMEAITASFDDATNQLTWSATFSASQVWPGLLPSAFTLALTPGPNPKGIDGELALIYFDAQGPSPVLTAYGYNGKNGASSFFDGSGAAGVQPPDPIVSSLLNNQIALTDTLNPNGTRTLGFSMDASLINTHVPLYGNPADWTGIAFGQQIGTWFHPLGVVNSTYSQGFLTEWRPEITGWFDGAYNETVPEPTTAAFALAGLALTLRRRRK